MAEKKPKNPIGADKVKASLPPGTLSYQSPPGSAETTVSLTTYNADDYQGPVRIESARDLIQLKKDRVNWISVIGYKNTELIGLIGQHFNLHMLTLEDILNTDHLPKIELIDEHLFVTLKMFTVSQSDKAIEQEHVSFILGRDFLLTFQEREKDDFEPVRERIRSGVGKARAKGGDYLLYNLIDRIVDNYYIALEAFEDDMDRLEEELIHHPQPAMAEKILHFKKQLTRFRKFIYPLREEFFRMLKEDYSLIRKSSYAYFRDVYDHLIHLTNTIENFRENMNGLMELHFSNNTDRMNSVVKTLTMISTVFIPLTFLAGIWGMNFQYMPELARPWAYPAALGIMLITGVSMYLYMKRKRWF